jgi:hypothetical protein
LIIHETPKEKFGNQIFEPLILLNPAKEKFGIPREKFGKQRKSLDVNLAILPLPEGEGSGVWGSGVKDIDAFF